jgi:bisphosphoglycerate-dependent phosphoglycerate mutase
VTVLGLLRHGESAGNAADGFTGWIDASLSEHGRAIVTEDLALAACGRSWVPVRRSRRLNSHHYGRPTLRRPGCVLVVSHGNTLRALVKHLEQVSDEASSAAPRQAGRPWCARCRS